MTTVDVPGDADENQSTIFICDYPVCIDQNRQKVHLETYSLQYCSIYNVMFNSTKYEV